MWTGADPLPAGVAQAAASTYQYAFGVPGQFVDPTGDWPSCSFTECLSDIGHMAWGEVLGAGDMIKGLAVWASPVGRWNDFKAGLACAGAWKTYGFDPLAVAATCQNLNPMNGIVQGFRDTYTFAMKGCFEASGRAFFPAMAQTVMIADGAAAGLRGSGAGAAGASIEDAITVDAEAAGAAEAAGQSGATARAARAVDDVDALPCNCFVAGTQVRAAGGEVPIEDLTVGDRVWAKNLETGADELRTITGLFSKQAATLMTITVADGASVVVTEEHPFYVLGVGWVMSGDLRVGDRLAQRDGGSTAITWISTRPASTTVYNFTVDGDHDYYVTDAQLLVHNCPTAGSSAAEAEASVVVTERTAPQALKSSEAVPRWDEFLGEGPTTNSHPRTGLPDPNRIVSSDGLRSIRFGPHEMGSSPTKFHFHEETWSFDSGSNTWFVDNVLVRVPFPKGAW